MSDYIPSPSTFEHLPNELLLVIFEYLNLYSVYKGFFGLNRRLNSLLTSNHLPPNILSLVVSLKRNGSFQAVANFFADRIIKLTTSTYRCDHLYDLSRFPNVRLLVLYNPSDELCEQVNLHTLPHLKYLHISDFFSEDRHHFYFNPYNISHLYSIRIDRSCFRIRWSKGDSVLHALRSLTITTDECHDIYLQILAECPHLILLKINLWRYFLIPMQKNPIPHLNLRRLNIIYHENLPREALEFMLSNVPNLTHLTVMGCLVDVYYDTLATILTRYTMHLKFLQIIIKPSGRGNERGNICIQQAHPLFVYSECSMKRTILIICSKKKSRYV